MNAGTSTNVYVYIQIPASHRGDRLYKAMLVSCQRNMYQRTDAGLHTIFTLLISNIKNCMM